MKIGDVKNISIDNLSKLQNDRIGYRTDEEIQSLRELVTPGWLKEHPIEISKNEDGSYNIEDGNHRLQIAKEKGIKEIPTKMVESWSTEKTENINQNNVERWLENDRNNGDIQENGSLNGQRSLNREINQNSSDQFRNRETAKGNDNIFGKGTQNKQVAEKFNQIMKEK